MKGIKYYDETEIWKEYLEEKVYRQGYSMGVANLLAMSTDYSTPDAWREFYNKLAEKMYYSLEECGGKGKDPSSKC